MKLVIRIDSPLVWGYVRTLAFCFEGYGDAPPKFPGSGVASTFISPPLGTFGGAEWRVFGTLILSYKTTTIGLVKRVGDVLKQIKTYWKGP
jgi:hypothetical protein